MTLKDIGEKQFLKKISKLIDSPILDFNEDASTFPLPSGDILVINADMLVDITDVLPGMTNTQIGKKAVTMSISDLIAKGTTPSGCLASVGFPSQTKIEKAYEILEGIREQCNKYNFQFLGGDLNNSSDIIIDIVSFGICAKDKLIPRRGSATGDIIFSTGLFGRTSLGFKSLLEAVPLPKQIEKTVLNSVFSPEPRYDFLKVMNDFKIDICMDSSDGLFMTLNELASINKLGINVTKVPIEKQILEYSVENNLNPLELAFSGGEEFELIFSIKPDKEKQLIEIVEKHNLVVHKLGFFSPTEKGIVITDSEFDNYKLSHSGFEHFSS